MEPHFARAEARHSVGLQDPETVGRDSELMRAGAAAKGWAVVPNRRGQLHCAGTNNCSSGCPTGAKRSMLVTSVPRALAWAPGCTPTAAWTGSPARDARSPA